MCIQSIGRYSLELCTVQGSLHGEQAISGTSRVGHAYPPNNVKPHNSYYDQNGRKQNVRVE